MGELDDDQPAELTLRGQADLRAFGDPLGSAMFNVHGQYLRALEQHLDTAFDRLGNPGRCSASSRRRARNATGAWRMPRQGDARQDG